MTPEEINKKYGYGKSNEKKQYNNKTKNTENEDQRNLNNDFRASERKSIMTITKQKNLAGVITALVIQLMFLFPHFSVAGAVNTLIVTLYLVLKNVVSNKVENENLSVKLGHYISITVLNIMIITALEGLTSDSLTLLTSDEFFGTALGAVVGSVVLLIGLIAAKIAFSKEGYIGSTIKYVIIFGYSYLFMNGYIFEFVDSPKIIMFALVIFYFVFWLIELFLLKRFDKSDLSIKIGVLFSSTTFIIISMLKRNFAANVLYGVTHLNTLNSWKWYTVAIISLVFVTAAGVCVAIDNNKNQNKSNDIVNNDDAGNLILIGFDIVCFAVGVKFYTRYLAIFAIMLFIVNIFICMVPFKSKKADMIHNIFNSKFNAELIMMTVLISLYIGFINGIIDLVMILILGVSIFIALYNSKWKYNVMLIIVGILGCDMAFHWHKSLAVIMFIVLSDVLFSIALFIIGVHNKKCTQDERAINIEKMILFICAAIILLTPMIHTGVYIYDKVETPSEFVALSEDAQQSEAVIEIRVRPHGKDNEIETCSYYWTSNKDEILSPELNENSFSVNMKGNDTLVVACTDANGVVTTYKHSYNFGV